MDGNYSEAISTFLNFIQTAKADYDWYYKEMIKQEDLTQDYLHQLELEHLDYKERARIATKLAQCRKDRREAKDHVEVLAQFIPWVEQQEKPLNQLKETLGKLRKEEQKINYTKYENLIRELKN